MAKCIMVQGTMSNVGKSIFVAALCRIFAQDGLNVCPFKSQNMALNSYVTDEGEEMSRAQVLQAQAAGLSPDVRMNPILLKPTGDMGSQVIVNGKPVGNYPAKEYFKMKKSLIPGIMEAYNGLAKEYDVIVIEGAGSPAEINLREDDIVNMGLAELVDARVILIGDIDPGGVFAQLYGTMELLRPEEKKRIAGTVINKFRGDIDLLKSGLDQIEELTGVPVLGVVPYMQLSLDDEDSLSEGLKLKHSDRPLDVAVIKLPHISNYTDITPIAFHPAMGIRYVSDPTKLGEPDMVILPGTKNTIEDMGWLNVSKMGEAIKNTNAAGAVVLGICGGYQILGISISDPLGIETRPGTSISGLGLLHVDTVLNEDKITCKNEASCMGELSDVSITGYQIHNGRTCIIDKNDRDHPGHAIKTTPFCTLEDGTTEGAIRGRVFGTYLHGLFDNGNLTTAFADMLLLKKGMEKLSLSPVDFCSIREKQLNELSDVVRKSVDMEKIYSIIRGE